MKRNLTDFSDLLQVKQPDTGFDLHPLLARRWSPRSFSERPIEERLILEMIEAARWAPSSKNEQPWKYVYALHGSQGFNDLWSCLSPGNQPWAKSAAALIVMMERRTFASDGKANPWARHDLGLANAQLVLQAVHRDIYAHLMGGFDSVKTSRLLGLGEDLLPVCIGAFGYLADPGELAEPYFSRELSGRTRKPLDELVHALD